ncbi:MAG TPA: NAD(P)H-dependent glycerol-3-phosphate dehydrogenase [Patescibacteria group bacterium]|nr:NAD(P)H-dependent glycerol-3-phosphate dehydrogenase [Patescibacteria group bacterium]
MDKKVMIIGHGVWGKALASVIKHNTSSISFWNRQDPITNVEVVILSLPVQSMREALTKAKIDKSMPIIINTSKGIEQDTYKLPHQICLDVLKRDIDYYTLIGPSFAEEVEQHMPTIVNLGYQNGENKKLVKQLFQTDYFRVKLTNNITTLELAGALKNVYAIICGLSEGMGFRTNTRAKLLILAMTEMQTLFHALGLTNSVDSLAGTVGDLFLTCNSIASRNFRFGKLLASYPAEEALKRIGSTVEGYFTSSSITYFQKQGIALPLASLIRQIIMGNDPGKAKELLIQFLKQV